MRTVAHDAIRWRKSSKSNDDGACVELAHTLKAMRDSKNPDGPVLAFAGRSPIESLVELAR